MPTYFVTFGDSVTYEFEAESEDDAIDQGYKAISEDDEWKDRGYELLGTSEA